MIVAFAIPEDVSRLAGSASSLRTHSDAVEVLNGASSSRAEHCARQALQAGSAEDEAACESALASVPDRLESRPAGEAVERGIVPRAVGQNAFGFASAALDWAESIAAGKTTGIVRRKLAARRTVLLAVSA